MVPAPATVRPKVSSSTVTPVIFARSEIPFHHRSNEACMDIAGLRSVGGSWSDLGGLLHVPEAALGLDHRLVRVLVEFTTQVADVALHDAGVAVEVVLPDVV